MKGMMAKSALGSFAYYGDRQSGSYRAFGKTAKKMANSGFGFAYVEDMGIMQAYDENLKDPKATSLIFVDKIFGQTCKFEGLADDKKGAKIWMKDVVSKLQGSQNSTEEVTEEDGMLMNVTIEAGSSEGNQT